MSQETAAVPAASDCVMRELIERWATTQPDKIFVQFDDGRSWSYARTRGIARRTANGLAALGVGQGEHVLSWLPNGDYALRTWFGLNHLGAVYVPVNTAYRGRLLEHIVRVSDARVIVVHADLAPRLAEIDRGRLETAVIVGGPVTTIPGLRCLGSEVLSPADESLPSIARPVAPWDTQSIIFTSGTTGPSKAVLSSYAHMYAMSVEGLHFLKPDDRYMINLPLFHVGGTVAVCGMLARGGSVSVVDAFDTGSFWRVVRETQTTALCLLGVMTGFLLKEPPSPSDRDHPLRRILMVPYTEDGPRFAERFGTTVYTVFNMTEISCPTVSEPNPRTPFTCGKVRAGVQVRLVDENDCEVPVSQVGEMIIRTDRPWALNHGYYGNPEATAKAWRNGWFHTGDAFRRDAEGNFYFVDRMKDAIRRRGENISSFEVESEVATHPDVREAAAIPVPNELSEDDVMVVVAPTPGRTIDPAALIEYLRPRMAHFMVPRYVRILPELPKTPTQKVQKHVLRAEGITADTWDREKAGIRISREKIGQMAS